MRALKDGRRWRRRVWGAWLAYALGAALCVGSLGMEAWTEQDVSLRMWEALFLGSLRFLKTADLSGGDLEPFLQSTLPAAGFLMSYAMMLPGALILWLAQGSRLFKWIGWVVWSFVMLMGPGTLTMVLWAETLPSGDPLEILGWGYWVWVAGVLLTMVAFWVVPAMRTGDAG